MVSGDACDENPFVTLVMTPAEAAASRRLGRLLSSDLPDVAAVWLVEGLDTPALRELAGHVPDDPWVIDELWTHSLEQLGVDLPSDDFAVRSIAVRYEVALWRGGHQDVERTMCAVLRLTEWDFPHDVPELSWVAGLEDELDSGRYGEGHWGRKEAEVLADLAAALTQLEGRLGPRSQTGS